MIPFALQYIIVVVLTMMVSVIATPLVRFLALRIGAVDNPNARRINKIPMPTAGGLAIFVAFLLATMCFLPSVVTHISPRGTYVEYIWPLAIASSIIIITGLLDDIKELRPMPKLVGMLLAAAIIWIFTEFRFDNFKIPFGGPMLHFPIWLSFCLTILWIVAITNAVNLIDGLDGLVSGVSIISLTTMGIVSYFFLHDSNLYLTLTIFVLVAAIIGFLPYNYHPAIIYLGDTGALFIGFMIGVLSLQGLKNSTAVAVVTPIIILGVPITDILVAIIRRTLSGQKIYEADRMHLHHRLLSLGLTHRGTVLVIYAISFIFSLISLLLNVSSRLGGVLLIVALLLGVEILSELIGIFGENRTPILKLLRFIGNSDARQEYLTRKRMKRAEKQKTRR
ncbi:MULTISPECIES: glycosyltransferase family 4 protein [unclassified Streptococcus]|uniref:glycosyltransferase family 4 protein n=1 Tax=unclassified Streptococcus TaxID=2608887 RepID=UPI001072556F|nr:MULTISPECIES: MraY family glycosyltransferase [unclassified Streptococcus]MBF0787714.1 undecaprenyl/decaprenyl-phosphate alpha-N-acetylglucosaminyl 1-phosphate transferase [Streptococcus sp. 19428wC2_LYSM12]MCQ9211215.1 undecaprenyl/decaprenyl-phosphate alpha-N-acetylglucosaminyl 1-phosphate transferase [Streptococcus sp. B01]MCQ9214528.1 undecaprenyl/decaprenyl-phosphate alpha-N-acetylglucosaminyl 1-phosphate transferase [Streptococcus sp. O1]TFV05323.1 undecaprenyl/decaprenyl-phosphate alp